MKQLFQKADSIVMTGLEWATSTKGAFYLLNFFIITAVILHPPTDVQGWLLLIVSEYYQGVALPGLGSQQKKDAEETRRLLQETHDTVMQEFANLQELIADAAQERAEIKETHAAGVEEIVEIKEILNLLQNGGTNHEK